MARNSVIKRFALFSILLCCAQIIIGQTEKSKLEKEGDRLFISYDNGKNQSLINKNVVTVKLKEGAFLEKSQKILRSNRLGYIDLSVPEGVDVEEFVKGLERSGSYEMVKYAVLGETCLEPNDTYVSNQWYLSTINMPSVWNITTGNPNVKVAVLDLEVDRNHQDIGMGDDGYKNINATLGYNYKDNTSQVVSPQAHGTLIAGVIGAKTNNSVGISGISGGNGNQGVTMIPYGVGSSLGSSFVDMSVVDDAILDAVDKGAKVINMSFRSTIFDYPDIDAAILYAHNHGVTLIAATGNDHVNTIYYPASNTNVIAVGAINQNLERSNFSNYGSEIDLVAPGTDIYSTTIDNSYASESGTSLAAPQVSGTIALMLSVNPTLTPDTIRNILRSTCMKLSGYSFTSGWNNEVGYGLLDAYAAVNTVAPKISGSSSLCDTHDYSIDNLPTGADVSWALSVNGSSTAAQLSVNTPAVNQCRITRSSSQSGSFSATLTATITYQNDTIKVLSKSLDGPAHFVSVLYTIVNTVGSGGTGGMVGSYNNIDIKPNTTYYLFSPYFVGKRLIALHDSPIVGNYMFSRAAENAFYVMVPQDGNMIAQLSDGCTTTTWSFWGHSYAYNMSISGGNGQLTVEITQEDLSSSENRGAGTQQKVPASKELPAWTLEVYEATTFKKMSSAEVNGNSRTLDTSSWPKGIYIVRAIVDKEILSEKITIQ